MPARLLIVVALGLAPDVLGVEPALARAPGPEALTVAIRGGGGLRRAVAMVVGVVPAECCCCCWADTSTVPPPGIPPPVVGTITDKVWAVGLAPRALVRMDRAPS